MQDSDVRLGLVPGISDAVRRRARRRLLDLDAKRRTERRALARRLDALTSEYRRDLSALLGPGGLRRYRVLRARLSKAPRSRRLRDVSALLGELGVDRARAARLRAAYLVAVRRLPGFDDGRVPTRPPVEPPRCPWVTYTAPYAGYFWSYAWNRSANPDDPVLARYLDTASGRIGSSVETRLSDAGDDDSLDADYYTALNVWHTPLATGPIEGYLAFEFRASTYSGRVNDEFGFSDATYNQWARARFKVVDAQGATDTQESRVFNVIGTAWGEDESWSDSVAVPHDMHWYYFRTATSFAQGRPVVVEAGVENMTWFECDDESITTADDLDLRLDRIMVRSCGY